MKKIILTLIICTFAFFKCASAEEVSASSQVSKGNPCARFARIVPKLKLRSSYGKLRYDYSHSEKELGIMASRHRLGESGMFTAGLALVDVDWSFSLNTTSRTVGDYICVIPRSIDAFVGYRNPVIYISKNMVKKDSCQYKVVLRHEQQHHQINVALLDYYLPLIKQKLEESLSSLKVVAVKNYDEAKEATDKLNREYTEMVRPFISRLQTTMQQEQRRLDNRENYEYETEICN